MARYTHGPGIDEPLIMDRGGQSYYYVVDGLGSIVKLINTFGNEVNHYRYDAFGNIIEKNEGVPNMFTYTGREYDTELGLYYYRSRYYDPEIGRFLSEDPIGFAGGMNFYTYAGNNPVKYADPFGLKRDCDQEHIECFRLCWKQKPPWPITQGSGGHYRYCQTKCLAEYMKCEADNSCEKLKNAWDNFNDWMQKHYPQPKKNPFPGIPPVDWPVLEY